ncbi:retron St85 family RNA-directed DNA polymerase [Epilithonimonas zeae]|uniref:RNA-directed DNA polymerase n=1 Tax=Epilithonimonas zeae TaxID=1416779 RepID=A0A1N6JIE7_9FLAO|nr:retron St85 family RNA-directed DNA polymerase [Epilithonimonas zeae]SIO44050.1 RNA-directed DNA polymerase [Epilithonimonas zeae]
MTSTIRLKILGLPNITDLEDFAYLINLSKNSIYQLSKNSEYYYKTYQIAKKNGKLRDISQPNKQLKGIQLWILNNILNKLKVSEYSKGFEKGQSISDNVRPHIFSNCLLNIDIKDFYPSINSIKVYNLFKSIGYNNLISTLLTNICTYKNSLPQGSPCSPKISNLICWKMDSRLQGYVGKKGIIFTRYADDITFSSIMPDKLIGVLPFVEKIIIDEGFTLNKYKTRFTGKLRRREITGLVIYDNNFGIGRKKLRIIRSKVYNFTKTTDNVNHKALHHLYGWMNYIKSVDEVRYKSLLEYIKLLYQKNPKTDIKTLYNYYNS